MLILILTVAQLGEIGAYHVDVVSDEGMRVLNEKGVDASVLRNEELDGLAAAGIIVDSVDVTDGTLGVDADVEEGDAAIGGGVEDARAHGVLGNDLGLDRHRVRGRTRDKQRRTQLLHSVS